jgi:hypothetical protein
VLGQMPKAQAGGGVHDVAAVEENTTKGP